MWIGEINVSPLLKAFNKFEQFRYHDKTEQEKAGIIQAFEYSFELSWKTMKRLIAENWVIVNSPRDIFRATASIGMIQNPELWFDFLKKRNITIHTYQEEEIEKLLSIRESFSSEVGSFIKYLEKMQNENG